MCHTAGATEVGDFRASSLATLVEVAVRDHLNRKVRGSAAARIDDRLRGESSA